MEKDLSHLLSMDRFGFCSQKKLTRIQDQNAKERLPKNKHSFYGWARLKALNTKKNGRAIKSTPISENPYHAEIILPEPHTKDHQIEHAHELAYYSKW